MRFSILVKPHLLLLLFVLGCAFQARSQSTLFAQLDGTGATMNTTGWTVMGGASLVDTNGDADANANEMQLTTTGNNTSGGIFLNAAVDMTATCDFWSAEFEARMFDGANYEGMAFIVTNAVPSSLPPTSGNLLGMPFGGFTGFSVCIDGFNDCGGAAPTLHIKYNTTDECTPGPSVSMPTLLQNAYNTIKVVYKMGDIDVYLNGSAAPVLSGNNPLSGQMFLGFTAANGATANGRYSIKNCIVNVTQATVNAGVDRIGCHNTFASLGALPLTDYTYSWSPSTNLSDATIANPSVGFNNISLFNDTVAYILTANIGSCVLQDTANVISVPIPAVPTVTSQNLVACEGDTLHILAYGQGLSVVSWYNTASGGTALASGSEFITPPLSANITYYAQTSNQNLCSSATRTAVNVLVNAAPAAPTANAPKICGNQNGIFTATAPAGVTFQWFASLPPTLPVHTGNTLNIGPVNSDTLMYVQATSAVGCQSLTLTTVNLIVDPAPNAITTVTDTVCKGNQATLSASSPGNIIRWFTSNLSVTPLATGSTYTTPNLSQNTVFWVNATTPIGCEGMKVPVSVLVLNRPDTALTVSDTICPGQNALLKLLSTGGAQYLWYTSDTATIPVFTGTTYNVSPSTTTTYYITTKVGKCTSSRRARAKALVDDIPPAPVVDDVSVCPYKNTELKVKSPGEDVAYFTWFTPTGQFLHSGKVYQLFNVSTPTTLWVRSMSYLGNCPNEGNVFVKVNMSPTPTANFTIDPDTVEINQTVFFADSSYLYPGSSPSFGIKFQWDLGNGYLSNAPKPNFSYPEEGIYPVSLVATNFYGCSDSVTKYVTVYEIRELWIPSAFSPNRDGHNDKLLLAAGLGMKDLDFVVYDRWGRVVYRANNINMTWDGLDMKNGELCPEGVYLYTASYTTSNGVRKDMKGSITLLR